MNVDQAMKIIIKPYITEKTFAMVENESTICFIVLFWANKTQISEEIKIVHSRITDSSKEMSNMKTELSKEISDVKTDLSKEISETKGRVSMLPTSQDILNSKKLDPNIVKIIYAILVLLAAVIGLDISGIFWDEVCI